MSKGFIKAALTKRLAGVNDIIEWLYASEAGPQLLRRVVDDCSYLLPCEPAGNTTDQAAANRDQGPQDGQRLSAGARILLRKDLEWLRDKANKL